MAPENIKPGFETGSFKSLGLINNMLFCDSIFKYLRFSKSAFLKSGYACLQDQACKA